MAGGALCGGMLMLASLFNSGDAIEPSPGFTLCVAPRPPNCVDGPGKSNAAEVCEPRVQAYIVNVFRYRECLEAESERQVRRANEVVNEMKCRRSKQCR